jgi:hypothetical protein
MELLRIFRVVSCQLWLHLLGDVMFEHQALPLDALHGSSSTLAVRFPALQWEYAEDAQMDFNSQTFSYFSGIAADRDPLGAHWCFYQLAPHE